MMIMYLLCARADFQTNVAKQYYRTIYRRFICALMQSGGQTRLREGLWTTKLNNFKSAFDFWALFFGYSALRQHISVQQRRDILYIISVSQL